MHRLLDLAHDLGVTIEFTDLSHLGRNGDCNARSGQVRLHRHLPRRAARSVLAHELAHYVFGDAPSKFGPVNAKQERRADEWAALQLITPDAYRDAEMMRGGHIPSMAHDLGVISRTVEAYQRVLARIGDTVYVGGRMGAGQFQHKVQIA